MWEKRSGQICPEIHYKDTNQGIVITSCYGIEGQIILPDEIHGVPIVGIAAYAFAENREEEEGSGNMKMQVLWESGIGSVELL